MRTLLPVGAAVALVIVVVGIFLALGPDRDDSTDSRDQGLNAILSELYLGYVGPVGLLTFRLTDECRELDSSRNDPSCSKFVSELERLDSRLVASIGKLNDFLDDRKGEIPAVDFATLTSTRDSLALYHESNVLLISSWAAFDRSGWEQAWEIRQSAAALAPSTASPSPTANH